MREKEGADVWLVSLLNIAFFFLSIHLWQDIGLLIFFGFAVVSVFVWVGIIALKANRN